MAVIEPMSQKDLKKSLLSFLNRKDVLIDEYFIMPKVINGKYSGQIFIEIICTQEFFDMNDDKNNIKCKGQNK